MAKMEEFVLPKMGESITEGTILNWLVQEGEHFEEGDILVEVGTDKVDNEVPALTAGIMSKHLFESGAVVEIGSAIAQFEESEGASSNTSTPKSQDSNKLNDKKEQTPQQVRIEMDRMRSMIADHMVYSKHTSPHVTAYVEADLTDLVHWRNANKAAFQEKHGERLTFTPLFVDAVARAIKEYPNINASVDGKKIIVKSTINVGMATALPSGNLIVPVVKNADQKSLPEIAADVNRMANLARENKLGGDDIKGGTFTISNVGTFGSLMGTPIINQPEVAILATGIIKKRAEVMTKDGVDSIEIRSMMMLSLSFDHRVVDGFLGGSFLKQVALNLEAAPKNDY